MCVCVCVCVCVYISQISQVSNLKERVERQGLKIHWLPLFIGQAGRLYPPGKGRGGRGTENNATSSLRRAFCGEPSSENQQGWRGLVSPGATPKPGPHYRCS